MSKDKKQAEKATPHFIPLISDYGFKVTFGNEENTLFLRKALQILIKSDVPIAEVYFDKTEYMGISQEARNSLFDIACIDERGQSFLVEMQLTDFEFFLHRMKYYAFHRFNTMVQKGNYLFDNLTRIYSIGILAKTIWEENDKYHNIGVIRNEDGYIMDNQITYVTIELDKFNLKENEVKTDLEKLVYTMKNLGKYTEQMPTPLFWGEDWIHGAIRQLDLRRMSANAVEQYMRGLAKQGSLLQQEKKRIELAVAAEKKAKEKAQAEAKIAWQAQEQAILKAKQEREEKEQAQQEKEQAILKAQQEQQEKEQAQQEKEQAILKAQQERLKAQQERVNAIIALHLQNMTKEAIAAIFAMNAEIVGKIIMDYKQKNNAL